MAEDLPPGSWIYVKGALIVDKLLAGEAGEEGCPGD
jgi:hypothetical protein